MVALVLAGPACDGGGDGAEGAGGDRPLVVATTTIVGELVARVAGDGADVEVLLPRGADPHGFQPAPADAALLRRADLVVANGLGLEEALADTLRAARRDGATVLEVAPRLDPLPLEEPGGGEGDAHGEHGDGLDPHVWQDPLRMADAADVVAGALDAMQPSPGWAERAAAFREDVEAAHREIEGIVAEIPPERRVLVTNHDTLGYFAARYGFEVVGVIVPGGSSLAEPSAADLARLVATIRQQGTPAIFAETIQPNRLAQALRRELGGDVRVVTLFTDSLGDEGTAAGSYPGMVVENARRIRDALV